MSKKYFIIVFLFALILGFSIYFLIIRKESPILPINPNGQTISAIKVDFYSQRDSRWANKELGTSRGNMSSTGCTVCCVAMALSAKNVQIKPDELNDKLVANDGFTKNGWLKLEKIQGISNVDVGPLFNSHQNIVESLEAGHPVITKIFLYGNVQHWVLIVGMDQGRYIIADPLEDSFSEKYIDKLTDKIYSIRTIK